MNEVPHQAHEPPDALLVHVVTLIAQVPGHLPDPEERRLQKLHVDQPHQRKIFVRLTPRRMVKRRPGNRQQRTLLAD